MKNLLTLIKKELRRFFTDPRMLISLILPGVLIFILYSFMGGFMDKANTIEDTYTYKIIVVNYDDNLDPYFQFLETDKYEVTYEDEFKEIYLEDIKEEDLDLMVVYPDNFFEDSLNYDPFIDGSNNSPVVEIYYNSTKTESATFYNEYFGSLHVFQSAISEKFRVNVDLDKKYDLASDESLTIMLITMLVPFLLITFLYSGAMSISIESIAGEKERGTIATLLATSVKRHEIALGKIIALSIVSLTGATSSFLGLMLSFPKLMGDGVVDLSIYGATEFLLLFFVIITTTFVYVVLISLISAYAKSIKEANTYSAILMILNMLVGVSTMAGVSTTNTMFYFIPILNSVSSITAILSLSVNPINLLMTIITNLTVVLIGVIILTLMFSSEKIMFKKS